MNPTSRFGSRAAAYAANRPGYSDAVVDALLEHLQQPPLVVADVGAGTGLSAAALASRGARVIAIEPNAAMRERAPATANVQWREGTGECTGLDGKAVDVAVAFQAFHWFDTQRAFAEFARIARRRIAMVQYERDERSPFCAAYGELVRAFQTDDTEALRARTLERFAELAGARLVRHEARSQQTLTREGLLGRIDSSSYLPHEGAAASELRSHASALFDRFAREGFVEFAMTTFVLYANLA